MFSTRASSTNFGQWMQVEPMPALDLGRWRGFRDLPIGSRHLFPNHFCLLALVHWFPPYEKQSRIVGEQSKGERQTLLLVTCRGQSDYEQNFQAWRRRATLEAW